MEEKIIKVYAPATIANLSAGFDVLGVAVDQPGDSVTAKRTHNTAFQFSVDQTSGVTIPTSNDENIAAFVASLMMQELKPDFGIEMILHKSMPIGSGLGSSAASCVAAAVAVNALLPHPLERKALMRFIIEGERKASGAAHADNAAPCLLGGACIVRNEQPIDIIPFSIHPDVTWIILSPHLALYTSEARKLLPHSLALSAVTRQMGNLSGLMLGLIRGEGALIKNCMVDLIAEPVRHSSIPAYHEIKKTAMRQGALGCGISGSGPAVFAVTLSKHKAEDIAHHMASTLLEVAGVSSNFYISSTNMQGTKIILEN